ncbi:MAG: hypothetical protein U9Q33_03660 [Campylobacterota bacterium]|nr:hypothetical protein [Campylobacterota bacterium]
MNFLNNLSVKGKINTITLFVIISLGILSTTVYNSLNSLETNYNDTNNINTLSQYILKTSQQGLQVAAAMRAYIIDPDDIKARNNFIKGVGQYEQLLQKLKASKNISAGYEKLNIERLYNDHKNELNKLISKINNNETLTGLDNKAVTSKWRPLKKELSKWQNKNLTKVASYNDRFRQTTSNTINFVVSLIIISIVIIIAIIQIIGKHISSVLNSFKMGLDGFFAFINRETAEAKHIELYNKDEFGDMARDVNSAIDKSVAEINQDNELIPF